MLEKLVSNYFLNVSNLFLCRSIIIFVFQIYGIILYSMYCLNSLLIALIKLSFDDLYFNIFGCISSHPILLLTSNLDKNLISL